MAAAVIEGGRAGLHFPWGLRPRKEVRGAGAGSAFFRALRIRFGSRKLHFPWGSAAATGSSRRGRRKCTFLGFFGSVSGFGDYISHDVRLPGQEFTLPPPKVSFLGLFGSVSSPGNYISHELGGGDRKCSGTTPEVPFPRALRLRFRR